MVNYACAFSQSESGKCFEWIIMSVKILFAFCNTFCTSWGCYLLCFSSSGSGSGSGSSSSISSTLLLLGHFSYRVAPIGTREKGQGNPRQSWILIPGTGSNLWNFDTWFYSLAGFRIPWVVIPIPKPRTPDYTQARFFRLRNPDSLAITVFTEIINAPCEKKKGITMAFDFSWNDCNTHEKLETMVI